MLVNGYEFDVEAYEQLEHLIAQAEELVESLRDARPCPPVCYRCHNTHWPLCPGGDDEANSPWKQGPPYPPGLWLKNKTKSGA